MTTETMNLPKPREGLHLASYINYFSEEGLDLDRFVEAGGRLVGREDSAGLRSGLADLRGKISDLRPAHPRLARQLELLAAFFAADAACDPETVRTLPATVCDETAFALFYTAKDMDLIPDELPEIGYDDDTAVVETVLSRHAGVFEEYCTAHHLEWTALKPGGSH